MAEIEQGPVGAERVLTVLIELAKVPEGLSLDELTRTLGASKPTVHRALGSLVRLGLATRTGRGQYLLGDEFLRLAFLHQDRRLDAMRLDPLLERLAEEFGETAHYAVLDDAEVVYRAKRDPVEGAIRLNSIVGGRNPAYRTGVGKVLLAWRFNGDREGALDWARSQQLVATTPSTITRPERLVAALDAALVDGFAVDDQEGAVGVNCVALPVFLGSPNAPTGAISVSALTFRMPLADLVGSVERIHEIAREFGVRTRP